MNIPFDPAALRELLLQGALEGERVQALYITGSSVNGYYRADSDIDVVAVTENGCGEIQAIPPNISVHRIQPAHFDRYESSTPYAHQHLEPLLNARYVQEISDRTKRAIAWRHANRLGQIGRENFAPWDVIENYLLRYALARPWRITPIRRSIASQDARAILTSEYASVLEGLRVEGRLEKIGDSYRINPAHVFHDEKRTTLPFDTYIKESVCGWHLLRNLHHMALFALRS